MDIVERLRAGLPQVDAQASVPECDEGKVWAMFQEAAATIEALRAELAGRDAEIAAWLRTGAAGIRKDSADGLWDDEGEANLTADDWEFLATAIASGEYRKGEG